MKEGIRRAPKVESGVWIESFNVSIVLLGKPIADFSKVTSCTPVDTVKLAIYQLYLAIEQMDLLYIN